MDVALAWNSQALRADWIIKGGTFLIDAGLQTAVLVSLFTDQVAAPDFVPPAGSPQDRRGWWGDTFRRRPIGSRLWQLSRSAKSGQTALPNKVQGYCQDALQWLIDDGIAVSIDVTTGWQDANVIGIEIVITKPSGITVPFSYEWVWQGA